MVKETKIYHIYNRGVDGRNLFLDDNDYQLFIFNLEYLNNKLTVHQREFLMKKQAKDIILPKDISALSSLYRNLKADNTSYRDLKTDNASHRELKADITPYVEILAFSLTPNHYHLLFKELLPSGMAKFLQKINSSYCHYYNIKNERQGHLFQSTYKRIESKNLDKTIFYSAYINGNSQIHQITDNAQIYPWSSYKQYLQKNYNFCNIKLVLDNFKDLNEYTNYVTQVIIQEKTKKYF